MKVELAAGFHRVLALADARDVDGLIAELQSPLEADPISFLRGLETQMTVRGSAASHLGRLRATSATRPLIELVTSDPNEHVRTLAVVALGAIGRRYAVDPLVAALDDSCEAVRARAALALGDLGDPAVVPVLIAHLAGDDWAMRRASAEALAKLGDRSAIEPVREAVKREGFRRRRALKRALRRLNKRTAAPQH